MFLKYNTQLGPPFHIIVDTNFVNFSIKNKIDMMRGFMDCLYAKGRRFQICIYFVQCLLLILVIPYIPSCVLGELEKMGRRFRLALKIIKVRFLILSTLLKKNKFFPKFLFHSLFLGQSFSTFGVLP
jgi:U3 small nucleolar RNA-associated protein 24